MVHYDQTISLVQTRKRLSDNAAGVRKKRWNLGLTQLPNMALSKEKKTYVCQVMQEPYRWLGMPVAKQTC